MLAEVDRTAGYHRPGGARRAALLGAVDLARLVPPAQARRMSSVSRLAVAAALLAVEDAALAADDPAFDDTAVVLATAFGPAWITERLLRAILHQGPEDASPALFTESVASAAAAQVAIACRACGPSLTVMQREAGPLVALQAGARLLRRGQARRALVGVVEEMTPLLHAVLDRFRALARPDAAGEERARPFDAARGGFLAAEGATVLVLEREVEAVARGARLLCRVEAAGSAFDPTAPSPTRWGAGHDLLAGALGDGLRRAALTPEGVDRVVSGASGAVEGDRAEALTLRRLWNGTPLPPVLAPKATTGEYGGGFLAAAVLAAAGAPFGATAGFHAPDPALGVVPHDGRPLPPPRRTLATTLAAGGAAAWAVLGAP